jgi:hypothetical protein
MFENRVLRKIFGLKRNYVQWDWRNYLRHLYCTSVVKNEIVEACGTYEVRNVHTVLVGKCEGKRPLPTPRRSWTDNITVDLHEVRGFGVDWMDPTQDRGK